MQVTRDALNRPTPIFDLYHRKKTGIPIAILKNAVVLKIKTAKPAIKTTTATTSHKIFTTS